MVAQLETDVANKDIPRVKGIPLVGSTLEMGKDPAAFFAKCYKEYGPVYQVNVFGRKQIVIAGAEAAKFMSTKAGRDGLRSKEFWDDFVDHFGASKTLTQIDGDDHRRMRQIMRAGFSREAAEGQYHKIAQYIDESIERDWTIGHCSKTRFGGSANGALCGRPGHGGQHCVWSRLWHFKNARRIGKSPS